MSNANQSPAGADELDEIVKFLLGEDKLDGFWYGDTVPGVPKYWWRNRLRKAITQSKNALLQEVLKEAKIVRSYINDLPIDFEAVPVTVIERLMKGEVK